MTQRLVTIGAGFAGVFSALSAARLRDGQGMSPADHAEAFVAAEPGTLAVV